MSIFQHRYSACANELATTCYYLLLNVSCAQILHKYCTNIARLHKQGTRHNWATRHTLSTQEQLSNKREVWETHGSPGHGVCVQMLWTESRSINQLIYLWLYMSVNLSRITLYRDKQGYPGQPQSTVIFQTDLHTYSHICIEWLMEFDSDQNIVG